MHDTLFEFEFGRWRFSFNIDLGNWCFGFAFNEHQCEECHMMAFSLHFPTFNISLDRLVVPDEDDDSGTVE